MDQNNQLHRLEEIGFIEDWHNNKLQLNNQTGEYMLTSSVNLFLSLCIRILRQSRQRSHLHNDEGRGGAIFWRLGGGNMHLPKFLLRYIIESVIDDIHEVTPVILGGRSTRCYPDCWQPPPFLTLRKRTGGGFGRVWIRSTFGIALRSRGFSLGLPTLLPPHVDIVTKTLGHVERDATSQRRQ